MRKRPSRRRLKARFMRYQRIALEDVYERDLVDFVKRYGYETDHTAMIRRYFKPVRVVLEEFGVKNLRAAFLGLGDDL